MKKETITEDMLWLAWGAKAPEGFVVVDSDKSIMTQLAARQGSQAHREGWSYPKYLQVKACPA